MVELTRRVISSDSLSISYRVTNAKDYPIWVCDGIDEIGQAYITMKGKVLYLRVYSGGLYPEGILLYVPPVALYSKLSPDESIERTLRVEFPVSERTRHVHLERAEGTRGKEETATRVVVQLGYLTQESIDALGPYARSLPQDRLEVAVLEVKTREDIIEVSISDVSVPVAIQARD